jgi:hypothetical protein
MVLDRTRIHPSIFAATDKFTHTATWGGGAGLTPVQMKANAEHTRLWMAQHGKGCAAWAAVYFGAFIGTIALKPILGKPYIGMAILLFMVFAFTSAYFLYQRSKRHLTTEELLVLMPALDLTPCQVAYAEAALALSALTLPAATADELWAQLNRLLDEESRLIAVRARGATGLTTPDSIAAERDEIRNRLEATTDPVSRDALERSLEICEGRFSASRDLSLVVQRVDAQLEMIAQSMRGMRDTLQRLITAPSEAGLGVDLEPLRETLEHARRHTTALEAAVSEVKTLA